MLVYWQRVFKRAFLDALVFMDIRKIPKVVRDIAMLGCAFAVVWLIGGMEQMMEE